MKSLGLKMLMWGFAFFFILTTLAISQADSREIGRAQNTFILSDEPPGNLISILAKAEYGDYNLYQVLLQIQADANPSVAGIITPAFLSSLVKCPANSQVFTIKLNNFPTGGSLAISTDGTVQAVNVHANDYYDKAGASTLLTSISGAGAGDANFVHSGIQPSTAEFNVPLTSWTVGDIKYNVFAVASGFVPAPPVIPTPTKKPSMDDRRSKTSFR